MVANKDTFPDGKERVFVEACHEALRRRYGKLGERSRREGIKFGDLVNKEYEKIRTSLSRCKNAESLRETIVDFWARAGTLPSLQEGWHDVMTLMDEKSWKTGRDLALLAMASYKPASKAEEEAILTETIDDDDEKKEE